MICCGGCWCASPNRSTNSASIFAPGCDHTWRSQHPLLAAGDMEIACLVDPAEVAGHKPATRVERRFGRLLVVEISEHQTGTAAADFADFTGCGFSVRIILAPDADLVTGTGAPAGIGYALGRVVGQRVLVRAGFGHAVTALRHAIRPASRRWRCGTMRSRRRRHFRLAVRGSVNASAWPWWRVATCGSTRKRFSNIWMRLACRDTTCRNSSCRCPRCRLPPVASC